MLIIAMVCMLVAVIALAVGGSFVKKNHSLSLLLNSLTLIAIVCLGFVVASYKNDFSGFSILVILSALPMFLTAFDFKKIFSKNATTPQIENTDESESDDTPPATENQDEEPLEEEKKKKNYLAESRTNLFFAIGVFLSAVCISIATMYIGEETFLGALVGILIGGATTFVLLALKKIKNPFDIVFYLLEFASIGLMLSNIVLALMYSFSTANIMFCIGCVGFGVFAGLKTKLTQSYLTNIYYVSMIFFLLSILL